MHYVNKGKLPKGGSYLICDNALRGLGCERKAWRYKDFEASFLRFVQELELIHLSRRDEQAEARAAVELQLLALRSEVREIERERDALCNAITQYPTNYLVAKLTGCDATIASLQSEIRIKEDELTRVQSSMAAEDGAEHRIKLLVEKLQRGDSDDIYVTRAEIAARIKQVAEWVCLSFNGTQPPCSWKTLSGKEKQDLKACRYFVVSLRSGTMRAIYPNDDDPLTLDFEFYAPALGAARYPCSDKTMTPEEQRDDGTTPMYFPHQPTRELRLPAS